MKIIHRFPLFVQNKTIIQNHFYSYKSPGVLNGLEILYLLKKGVLYGIRFLLFYMELYGNLQ